MKILTQTLLLLALISIPLANADAQNRDFRTQRILLDDGNSNTILLQTPAGPITGGTLTIPDPGGAGQFLISNPAGGSQSISGDLFPGADDTYDLGSGASRWQDLFLSGNASVGGQLNLVETGGGTDYVGFQAPAAVTANQIWTLPAADGTGGQVLSTDGAGVLSWITNSATVSTDLTLTGDGSGLDPLGIDLTNANTWSGTQTLATNAAQGDALIASVNAGSTVIAAPRIGPGLTDAQVNDALTISGGTIDGSPIGATTPSTGAFSTLSGTSSLTLGTTAGAGSVILNDGNGASLVGTIATTALTGNQTYTLPDATGTFALTSDLSVATDLTLTGDGEGTNLGIDLTHSNAWTAAQSISTGSSGTATLALSNDETTNDDGIALAISNGAVTLSNATFTASDPPGDPTIDEDVSVAIVNATVDLDAGASPADIVVPGSGTTGQILYIVNSSGTSIDVVGAAGGILPLADNEGATFIYDGAGWVAVQ